MDQRLYNPMAVPYVMCGAAV